MAKHFKIKGILIDVKNLTVEEVELENSLQGVYEKLGCDCVTTVPYPFDENHEIIVDDESLMKDLQNFFTFNKMDIEASVCGNGLIVSWDESGNWINHGLDVEEVRKGVSFLTCFGSSAGIVAVVLPPKSMKKS